MPTIMTTSTSALATYSPTSPLAFTPMAAAATVRTAPMNAAMADSRWRSSAAIALRKQRRDREWRDADERHEDRRAIGRECITEKRRSNGGDAGADRRGDDGRHDQQHDECVIDAPRLVRRTIARAREELESDERDAEGAELRDERHDLIDDARDADTRWTQQHGQELRSSEPGEHRERLDGPERDDGLERAK